MDRIARIIVEHSRRVLALTGIITLVSVAMLFRMSFNADVSKFITEGNETGEAWVALQEKYDTGDPINVLVSTIDGAEILERDSLVTLTELRDEFIGLDSVGQVGTIIPGENPLTGEVLWEMEGATTECVTTMVTDGERVFTSGGYPKNHVSAIAGDGSKETVWENISRVYVPSMLVRDGYLFAVMDGGIACCWKTEDGTRMWKERLGGTFSSSPVLVGDHIYAANEKGDFFVFKADPENFEIVAKNKLGDEVFATPTICDGRIFARVSVRGSGGKKEGRLFCLGNR